MHHLKSLILTLVFLCAGLVFMSASLKLDEHKSPYLKALFRELATVSIVALTLHGAYEYYLRRDFARMVNSKADDVLAELRTRGNDIVARLDLGNETSSLGLSEITRSSWSYDYGELLASDGHIALLLNDGRSWVSRHSAELRARFRDRRARTDIYLIHPDSPMLEVLAAKEGTSSDAIRRKIRDTLHMLSELEPDPAHVNIFGHRFYNPHALYISQRFAIVAPYFHSGTRRAGPAFRYDNIGEGGLYEDLIEDLGSFAREAERLQLPPVRVGRQNENRGA